HARPPGGALRPLRRDALCATTGGGTGGTRVLPGTHTRSNAPAAAGAIQRCTAWTVSRVVLAASAARGAGVSGAGGTATLAADERPRPQRTPAHLAKWRGRLGLAAPLSRARYPAQRGLEGLRARRPAAGVAL